VYRATFIAAWLCTYCVPIKEAKFIHPEVITMAVEIAQGSNRAIGITSMAFLYCALDNIHHQWRSHHDSRVFPGIPNIFLSKNKYTSSIYTCTHICTPKSSTLLSKHSPTGLLRCLQPTRPTPSWPIRHQLTHLATTLPDSPLSLSLHDPSLPGSAPSRHSPFANPRWWRGETAIGGGSWTVLPRRGRPLPRRAAPDTPPS
jgi:hypothetical protein